MKKRLALKRDVLGDLSSADLAGIAGGTVGTVRETAGSCVEVLCLILDLRDEINASEHAVCTSVWQCTFGCG